MAEVVQLKNENGTPIYPVTSGEAINVTGGKKLDTVFSEKCEELTTSLNTKFSNLKTTLTNDINTKKNSLDSTISGLSAVATSGSYNDLSGKPSYATVASTGNYNDLSNKPSIGVPYVTTCTVGLSGSIPSMSVGQIAVVRIYATGSEDETFDIRLPSGSSFFVLATSSLISGIYSGGYTWTRSKSSDFVLLIIRLA